MGCINPDNSLTPTAHRLLTITSVPVSAEQIARELQFPLFKVRSSLRELMSAELIREENGSYVITEKGKEMLNK